MEKSTDGDIKVLKSDDGLAAGAGHAAVVCGAK